MFAAVLSASAALFGALIGGGVTYAVTTLQLDRNAEMRVQDQRNAAYSPVAEEAEGLRVEIAGLLDRLETNPDVDLSMALNPIADRLNQLRPSITDVRIVGSDDARRLTADLYTQLWAAYNNADVSIADARIALEQVWQTYVVFTNLARDEVGVLDVD